MAFLARGQKKKFQKDFKKFQKRLKEFLSLILPNEVSEKAFFKISAGLGYDHLNSRCFKRSVSQSTLSLKQKRALMNEMKKYKAISSCKKRNSKEREYSLKHPTLALYKFLFETEEGFKEKAFSKIFNRKGASFSASEDPEAIEADKEKFKLRLISFWNRIDTSILYT